MAFESCNECETFSRIVLILLKDASCQMQFVNSRSEIMQASWEYCTQHNAWKHNIPFSCLSEIAKSCFTFISNISGKLGKNDVTETLTVQMQVHEHRFFCLWEVHTLSIALLKKVRIFFDTQPYLGKSIAKRKIRVLLPAEPWRMPVRD